MSITELLVNLSVTLATPLLESGPLSLSGASLARFVTALAIGWLIGRWLARVAVRSLASRLDSEDETTLLCRAITWGTSALFAVGGLHFGGLLDLETALEPVVALASMELIVLAGTPISPATVVGFGLILLAGWWASLLLQGVIRRALPPKNGDEPDPTVDLVTRFAHYTVLLVATGIALGTLGVDLGALLAAGAVLGVGIGLALQSLARNFISGLILVAERTIKPGDVLEVEGRLVKVVETRLRTTIVRTLDDEDLIVPNDALVETTIKNHTLRDRMYRVRAEVGVVYSTDLDVAKRVIEEAAARVAHRVEHRDPVVLLSGFGASSIDFNVSVWIDDPWALQRFRSRLHFEIWRALREAGIVIAFPQLDVHLDPPVSDGIVALARRAS